MSSYRPPRQPRDFSQRPSGTSSPRRDVRNSPRFVKKNNEFDGEKRGAPERGWDAVASWYDQLVGEKGSDYHQHVILPAALDLLAIQPGERVIDICCGQGVLLRPLLDSAMAAYCGIDASAQLIDSAKRRYMDVKNVRFKVADACAPGSWADGSYDVAACLMAVHDVPNLPGLCTQMSASLREGGRALLIFMHPCFRMPKHSHWGFDNDQKIQYRRMDRYVNSLPIEIQTHPGKGVTDKTIFYHRSLGEIISTLGESGLAVVTCEELMSHRRSQVGGAFSRAEHRAAEEFPLFIALGVVKY